MVRSSTIRELWWILAGLLLAWGWHPVPAAAQARGAQLLASPQIISFTPLPGKGELSSAQQTVTVQVVAPPHQPWRITIMAQGDLQSAQGKTIPIGQVTWKGSPGSVFTNGTLSANRPQLLGQGQGSKVGTVRLFLKRSWEHSPGKYSQQLLLQLSSP